ncbi:hypothetical protein AAC387_Pa11g2237 [Persea americana]
MLAITSSIHRDLGHHRREKASSSSEKKKEEANSTSPDHRLPEASTKASARRKRIKSNPHQEPEFFPDQRNLSALEEGGELFQKKVDLFCCTEAQLRFFEGQGKVTCIPVVIVVVSNYPPSDKIVEFLLRLSTVDRLKTQIFIMRCKLRRAALRHLKLEQSKKYEYSLPYFENPLKEDELEQDTVVHIIYPSEPPISCNFDWELDDLGISQVMRVKDEALPEQEKDAFKDYVKEKVREAKRAQREKREYLKKKFEETSEAEKAEYENIKFYKFYPVQTPEIPDISQMKVAFISRYYGKAHKKLLTEHAYHYSIMVAFLRSTYFQCLFGNSGGFDSLQNSCIPFFWTSWGVDLCTHACMCVTSFGRGWVLMEMRGGTFSCVGI